MVEDVGCGGGLRDEIIWRWWESTQGGGLGGWGPRGASRRVFAIFRCF